MSRVEVYREVMFESKGGKQINLMGMRGRGLGAPAPTRPPLRTPTNTVVFGFEELNRANAGPWKIDWDE